MGMSRTLERLQLIAVRMRRYSITCGALTQPKQALNELHHFLGPRGPFRFLLLLGEIGCATAVRTTGTGVMNIPLHSTM